MGAWCWSSSKSGLDTSIFARGSWRDKVWVDLEGVGFNWAPFLCVTPSVDAKEALQGPVKDTLVSQGRLLRADTVGMCRGGLNQQLQRSCGPRSCASYWSRLVLQRLDTGLDELSLLAQLLEGSRGCVFPPKALHGDQEEGQGEGVGAVVPVLKPDGWCEHVPCVCPAGMLAQPCCWWHTGAQSRSGLTSMGKHLQ